VVDGLLQLMQRAREDIVIVSPYFVPGAAMMKVFGELRARGIRIRVLTNSLASNDAPAAHAGYARYRKDLLALGIELHEMRAEQEGTVTGLGSTPGPGSGLGGGSKSGDSRASLHSKAVVIDQRLAVIGSMNLDLRSQRQNSEVALLIRSRTLSREAVRQVETTLSQGAYRVVLDGGQLLWQAPPGAGFETARSEPDASAKLRLMVRLVGPFAPVTTTLPAPTFNSASMEASTSAAVNGCEIGTFTSSSPSNLSLNVPPVGAPVIVTVCTSFEPRVVPEPPLRSFQMTSLS